MARAIHPVVVGTSGHIDHGKSSLVKALTGIDPDRLPEEQERGLTIDLGFARFKLADGRYVGMVDVPGHERFVRNMVAGCTGLDLAILVVAADDGVMPQTREHLDILDLLGVRGGLIALTKVDMVDEQIADLAAAEVRELVQGTVLQDAELVRVSSVTGEGIDEFKQKLTALAQSVAPRPHGGPFRMPIQRVFSLPGIGTVITGIPVSGSIRPGAELEILPLGEKVRLRGLHAYGGKVEEAVAGHSTALSVPDARESGVHRGMVAAEPGVFATGTAVDLDLRLLARARPVRHRTPVRFHTGTIEVQGELLLLDRDRLEPGERANARILLEEEICCARTDRFLLRLQNPAVTIGGGVVLRLQGAPGRYRRRELGGELDRLQAAGDQPEDRIRNELERATAEGIGLAELAQRLQLAPELVATTCAGMADVAVHERAQRAFLRSGLEAGERELLASVDRILQRRPNAASLVRSAVRPSRTLPQPLIDAVFDRLREQGRVRAGSQGRILFRDRLQPLPPDQQARLGRLVAECERLQFRPPVAAELAGSTGVGIEQVDSLLERGQDEGLVEKVAEHWYGARALRRALHSIRDNCLKHAESLDIPALRDQFDTSRKYLIPLLEHVDAMGLTVLRGGVRRLLLTSDLNRELAAEAAAADGTAR